ncbi:MAG TPA: MFS transporter [Bacteroidales bacterium]|nr:MAG: fucose permease [Bacteroidetes bacterium GWF2_33_38]OFY76398.1 MAG: fucose permease [Bacteroidetes bacterium RIFOXYA12_FULL_33_9]OFY88608.1 MAG: fucose permease [Bacteroidetes bacterium RIFOXYA2_FULL_33_7]HBF88146.1 MFS transporter [Bacteroidales bacterium]
MSTKKNTAAIFVITSLFFMWGFMTCMNDILIPHMKKIFELTHFRAMLVQFSFFGAYFVGSIIYFFVSSNYGDPINKIGYKRGIIVGLVLSAIGTSLFYPASEIKSYGFFLSALFVIGLGFTMLQIAANPYISILGDEKTASGRLNLAQGFNSLGTTIAPLIGGFLIFKYFANSDSSNSNSVQIPYLIFTVVFILIALIITFTKLPHINKSEEIVKGLGALKFRHLKLGMIAIFMYVGAEVGIGSILISFIGLDNITGLTENEASTFVAFYWGGLMIGRFMGAISLSKFDKKHLMYAYMIVSAVAAFFIIYLSAYAKSGISLNTVIFYVFNILISFFAFIAGKSKTSRTLFIFSLLAIAFIATAIFTNGYLAMWLILGVGIFNSIMWSNIFTLSIAKLGKFTSQGSSLLIMMIVGGATLPIIQGYLADKIGIQYSFIIPLLAYIYIAYFGLKGYKIKELPN